MSMQNIETDSLAQPNSFSIVKALFLLMKRILGKRFTVHFVEISSATAHIYGECVME